MPSHFKDAVKHFNNNYPEYIRKLKEFVSIPSISTDSNHSQELVQAAEWLVRYLKALGIQNVQLFPTQKNPIIYGEFLEGGKDKPVVLIYAHYDVQPPDPLEEWKSDPFTPIEKDGCLLGRGASDMKGQLMVCLAAVDSIMKTGKLEVNLKFILEGEEEIGSPSIEDFLHTHQELLKSDFALNLDAGMVAENSPTIVYGLRGLAYFELMIKGPAHDLHSGLYGGIIYNPAQALCECIASLKNKDGQIQIPGFYDDVVLLDEAERQDLSRLPVTDRDLLEQTGVSQLWGERGFTTIERLGARPTLEVHGILTGYVGEGPKTVIPSKAMVKISTRLVPNQTPAKVFSRLKEHFEKVIPPHVTWDLTLLTSDYPCVIDRNFFATRIFTSALRDVFLTEPVFERGGGSIPIVSYMQEALGINSVLSGFALPDDRAHSPNEHINLSLWKKGVETVILFFVNLSQIK